ncbi:MAG: hypothetical protein IT371_16635 [Deltaproteobacteria bacterium]|nr:hypothetical protein [Deltaproteobacteria bacterium]
MSEQPDPKDAARRITELEAEVARLKAATGAAVPGEGEQGTPDHAAGAPSSDSTSESESGALDADLSLGREPSRSKTVLLGAGILAVTLGLMAAVFFALSTGFNSVAHRAAKSLVPMVAPRGGAAEPEAIPPPPARFAPSPPSDIPRAPGL